MMVAFNPPKELNGIPLSERTRWLLFAPTWMFFPHWKRRVLQTHYDYIERESPLLRDIPLHNDDMVTTISFRTRNDHS